MSFVDISDPHITAAYDALHRSDPLRWFLLTSGNKPNVLSLCASGTGDLDELRSYLTPGSACYGLFREQVQDKCWYVLLTYIPDSVKGVWRARALVHGRAVSSKLKADQVLNASSPDQVTTQALRTILDLHPRGSQASPITATFSIRRKIIPDLGLDSLSLSANQIGAASPVEVNHPRSVSSPPVTSFSSPPAHKTSLLPMTPESEGVQARRTQWSSPYASLLAKKESSLPSLPLGSTANHQDAEQGSINSGRSGSFQMGSIPDSQSIASHDHSSRPHSPTSVSAILSHSPVHGSAILPSEPTPSGANGASSLLASPSMGAWKDNEHRHMIFNKLQGRIMTSAEREEERKLTVLEEERRRRTAERARREKEEREAEELREREFEERKEREMQRRLERAKKAEEQRIEQKRQEEEEEARRKLEKEQKEIETLEKRKRIKQHFEKRAGMNLLSGFITLEWSSSWKRRYYRLSTEDWAFFKNDEETTTPIHVIELSRVQALREWQEGYEQLEAIPHSFAVELEDDPPLLFFADSAEDKEIIMGLLNQAAGL